MICKMLAALSVFLMAAAVSAQEPSSCKNPTVEERLLADDVRYASPFYVVALPRTPKTEDIDNVCYTYYETGEGPFFHIMSVVYKNGSNSYYTFSKKDISDRMGLAEATVNTTSSCTYHDYTLVPICNVTVFVLYRCFISGDCNDIDIGRTPGVDVRLVLAATTDISDACRQETEANLKDTSSLDGGDYIILPQNRKPQCITKFNNKLSINPQNALGSITVIDEAALDRFGERDNDLMFTGTTENPSIDEGVTESQTELPEQTEIPLTSSVTSETTPAEGQGGTYLPPPLPIVPAITFVPQRTYADVVKYYIPRTVYYPKIYYHIQSWDTPPPGFRRCVLTPLGYYIPL